MGNEPVVIGLTKIPVIENPQYFSSSNMLKSDTCEYHQHTHTLVHTHPHTHTHTHTHTDTHMIIC